MNDLTIKLHDVKVHIRVADDRYFRFLKTFFHKVCLKVQDHSVLDVVIDILWEDQALGQYLEALKKKEDFHEVGASTLTAFKKIAAIRKIERKKKVIYRAELIDRQLKIKAVFQYKPFKDFWQHSPWAKPMDEWFFTLTYHLIYYPVFWYLEYFRHIHMLHASAISCQGKGIVICGLENIGKTSLALMFLAQEDTYFLSDNLIFYDHQKVYPCYELVRIHKTEATSLWEKHFEGVDQLSISKDLYQLKSNLIEKGVPVDVLIFPEFSRDFFIQEFSVMEATNRAMLLSHLPSELGNYTEYRHLYGLLDLNFNPWISAQEVLKGLLRTTRSLRVGMPKADGLKKNFERVKEAVWKRGG